MIATLAFLALAQPSAATPIAASPAAPVAAPANPQDDYDRAAQIYAQTCDDRAYGAYDDLCNQLQKQLRQYRIELDRQAREAASKPAKAAPPPGH